MRTRSSLRAVAALLGLIAAAGAVAPPRAAHAAATVIAPASSRIDLEISKGRLVKLDHPAASVFVADPDIADIQVKSPNLVYVIGKSAGETTLFAVGENDEILANTNVVVRHDIAALEHALQKVAPDSAINVNTVDDALVLSGTVYSAAEGDDIRRVAARFVPDPSQLINNTQVDEPNQVNLRVRVAEMSREVIKSFGFNWENMFSSGNFLFGLATGNPVLATGTTTNSILPNSFLTRTNGTNSLIGSFHAGNTDINALIDALDSEGLVTVLAEPNLTSVSGQTAS
ncbi:MAG: pilus assembly protein N-terminal domain-containing protein, partial [Alphaproteobacteria bacterium]|nr:pilus assembly protein N-terminal domain-containing protein [Alphaproteobacteria bacterium]